MRAGAGPGPVAWHSRAVRSEGRRLAMFPLSCVLYPLAELVLQVFEPRYQELLADCLAKEREFGVVLIERGSEVGGGDQRVAVGTLARIETAAPLGGGRWVLSTRGVRRLRVARWLPDDPYPVALVDEVALPPAQRGGAGLARAERAVRRTRALLSELGRAPALAGPFELADDAEQAAWRLCALAPVNPLDGQRLLEIDDPGERLAHLADLCDALAGDLSGLLAEGGS